ncbi:MAG: hypothetical protein COB15_13495 [Flavobacteriales bacterium]|nr:MAG: hypothetical protein COB15_13495 [Flavobacteriales bacterium]
MKHSILFFTLTLITLTSFAKEYSASDAEKLISGSQTVFIDDETGAIKFVKLKSSKKISVKNNVAWLNTLLNVSNSENFKLFKTESDQIGYTHYRYKLYLNGAPVEDAVYYIHSKNGYIVSANGEYYPNIKLSSKSAVITSREAISIAKKTIKENKGDWNDEIVSFPIKVVVKSEVGEFKLAHKVDVYSREPLARKFVYVDAITGQIIKEKDRIHHADVVGSAVTKYNGTQAITSDSFGGSYRLRETGRGNGINTFDLNTSTTYSSAVDFTDADNLWNTTTNQDDAAYDAHFGSEATYDYFFNNFGRNSYDNSGAVINSYVHYSSSFVNAFWDGTQMTYGDGDGTNYTALTSIDVVGHEITHAITENSANLVYSYESGALNESFSDIFGIAIDFDKNPSTANYLMGDQFAVTGTPFRSMSNPNAYGHPDTYNGTNWATGSFDNGGVHTNSGVQNYWFYLLSNGGSGTNDIGNSFSVTGIGIDPAAAISYRNLTTYLTTNSQYVDARYYAIQSAIDLYGSCSAEVIATTNAWYAVGVGNIYSNSVIADFTADITYSCSTPSTITFTNNSINGTSYLWSFGDGNTSTTTSPSHTYTSTGVYTVTLITNGSSSCGTNDTTIKTNYITITNTGGPISASCTPASTTPGTLGMGIFNFSFASISNNTSGGTDGYQDYTCTNSTTVTEGNSYNVNITTGTANNEDVRVWIDLNNDGQFNMTNEMVFVSDNIMQNHSGSIIIPGGAVLNTPLRMRVGSDYHTNNFTSACTDVTYGQYEDYSITVIPNTSPPIVDFIANNTTINIGQTISFTDLSQNVPTSWTWDITGSSTPSSTLQNPTATYSALGVYPVKLVAANSFGTDSLTKTGYINVINSVNMCSGLDSTNATNGVLYDSGGSSGYYSNNENCSFLINPGCATSVTLTFNSFYLESCCDYFRVYDGVDASGTLLLSANGTSLPSPVTANSGSMYITFTSDGSVIRDGWEATWSSTIPSTPPGANFTISDITPPLNTPVQFTDATTNLPNSWLWSFGDGNTSTLQNPSHAYTIPGTYSVQLIVDNCFATDTVSYSITAQDSAFITINPNTLFPVSLCGDSVVEQLTIYNSGNGTLVTSITGTTQSSTSAFFDGFEDGTTNNWTPNGSSTYNLITSNTATGNYALSMLGNSSNGLEYDFTPDTINYVSVKLRSDDNSSYNNYFMIGTPTYNYGICYIVHYGANTYRVIGGSSYYHTVTNSSNWTDFEIKNINYTSKTFDLFIDGNLVQSGMSFNNSSMTNISKLKLYNYDATYAGYYDDIQLGENIAPQWISMTTTDTIVPANDSVVVDVVFNASGLFAGTYYDTLTINSNDPTNNPLLVPIEFTVTGQPLISVSPNNINFGTLQVGASISDTIYIDNLGCDTLDISSFISSNVSFSVSSGGFQIPPYGNDTIIITFSPDTIKTYADTLFINNNDTLAYVLLNGAGVGAPIISYNPTSITETITSCNDSITIPVTVYNTGQGPLYTSLNINGVISGSTSNFFDGFEDGTYNNWTANGTSSNFQVINSNPATGNKCLKIIGSSSNTLEYDFTPDTINYVSVKLRSDDISSYNNYFMLGNASYNYGICYIVHSGTNQYRVYGGSSYFHTVTNSNNWTHFEVKNINYTSKTFDLFIDGNLVQSGMSFNNSSLTNISKIKLYNYDTFYGGYYDDIQIGSGVSPNWIAINTDTLNTAIADSSIFYVTLYSAGLNSGTYNADIILASNDPLSPFDTIPVSFTVDGSPEISFSDTCLNFGSIMENTSATDSVIVYNQGCDTLFITNVTTGISEYSPNTTNYIVLPGDSVMVHVTFSPTSVGTFNSFLTIYNNDVDTTICLTGSATSAPIITTNPTSFNISLSACEDSLTLPLTIYNIGGSDLNYSFSNILGNGYDSTITQYYTSTGQNLNYYFNGLSVSDSVHLEITINGDYDSGSEYADLYVDGTMMQQINDGNQTNGTNIVTTYSYGGTNASTWLSDGQITIMLDNSSGVNTGIGGTGLNQVRLWLEGVGWITPSVNTGTVSPSDSSIVDITFNSNGMSGGVYNTEIIITSNDPLNPFDTIPVTLTISNDPCAEFSHNIPNVCSGQVNFTDETTNSPTSWSWSFGDGNSSTMQNPINTYASSGNYNVQLIACNSTSCDTISYMVTITNTNGPAAAFCTPTTTNVGSTGMGIFNFTFSTINNSTNGGTDGYQDYTCTNSATVTEGNTYNVNITTGTGYNEDVRVWIDFDNDGQFNMTNELVFISDNILVNHSGSIVIPTGGILSTPLLMRVGSDYYSNNFANSCQDVMYGQYEDYTVIIQSNNQPPVSNYSYSILDQCQGIILFNDLSTNFPTSWIWNFDDGTTSTFQNPFHTYTTAGIYNVTLITTNAFGSSSTYSQTVIINSLNATISVLSPVVLNQPINFNANATGAISWNWNFGDGSSATIQSPTHIYTTPGTYVVTLIATNGFGCVSTVYDTLNIYTVSIDEHKSYFEIYPNPNNGNLKIINKSSKNIKSILVMNSIGKVVFNNENKENFFISQKIKLTDVSTGIYFIKVLFDDNKFITKKFLIKR